MNRQARQQKVEGLRRRLWFLRERLNDVTHDSALAESLRREKKDYYTKAIAGARARLVELEGH